MQYKKCHCKVYLHIGALPGNFAKPCRRYTAYGKYFNTYNFVLSFLLPYYLSVHLTLLASILGFRQWDFFSHGAICVYNAMAERDDLRNYLQQNSAREKETKHVDEAAT